MAGGMNLATKYIRYFNDMFYKEAQITLALKNRAEYKGSRRFEIATVPLAPLNDYVRAGMQRYGTPNDLTRNIQLVEVTQDKGFAFIIDRGDREQSEYIMEAGRELSRETKYVVVPNVDRYCFGKLATGAQEAGGYDDTALTKANAYEEFLEGQEYLGDYDVPDTDRICYCSYHFANLMKQDPAFMKYGNLSQEMINKGVLGEVDGTKIVRVSSTRLPKGASFMIVHPMAASLAQQLEEYRVHDNPPGVSGWLVEGRVIYDCFVHDDNNRGLFYHGGAAVLGRLSAASAASKAGKTSFIMYQSKDLNTNKWYVVTAATREELPALEYGTAIDVTTSSSPWYVARELRSRETEMTIDAGHAFYKIVETDANMMPLAYTEGKLNIG